MKTRIKAILIAGVVVLATALATLVINVSTTTNIILKSAQSTAQSATPTPTTSYAKLPGTWTYDCEFPVQRSAQIMLTCADGGVIVTDITWKSWTTIGATGTGTYSQNMCDPSCAEGNRINVSVALRLGEPLVHKGRNILKTLDIDAVAGRELPNGATNMTWDVAEFAVRMNWDSVSN